MSTRKLWLIRHAKSDWSKPGQSDFDRPLNGRGRRDGPRMVDWLRQQDHPANWIWSSPAARALATTAFVQAGFELAADAVVAMDELYHAAPEQLLAVIRQTPAEIDSVAIVAHNPGLTWLVNTLAQTTITDNLPTFGVARFDVASDWLTLQPASTSLELLEAPKTIDRR